MAVKHFKIHYMVLLFMVWGASHVAYADRLNVLVVMSYESDFPWCRNVRTGIETVLDSECDIRYFYMNTKSNLSGGKAKANEAFDIYLSSLPDGVIAADDNAQSMFVVPFLKDKVKTPVMFCGVNADPAIYGYPATNVSGIMERPHFNEAFSFAQQLVPSIKSVGFITKESPTGEAHYHQLQRERDTYSVTIKGFEAVTTVQDLIAKVHGFKNTCDALFIASLAGIVDRDGKPVSEKEGTQIAIKAFGNKPTIGDEKYTVTYGALCSVVRTGQEQGEMAAKMLLQAMKGRAVSDIPMIQNQRGERIINATMIRSMGLKIRPEILRGAQLVKTVE